MLDRQCGEGRVGVRTQGRDRHQSDEAKGLGVRYPCADLINRGPIGDVDSAARRGRHRYWI